MPLAVSPSIPTESSTAAPGGKFSDWFKNIGDWIKALSPGGATQYDTGWVTTGLTITAGTDWSITSYRLRRIGITTFVRISFLYTGAGYTTSATGDGTDSTMCTLPAGWRPDSEAAGVSVSQNGAREFFGQINTAGALLLTHGMPSQTLPTSTPIVVRSFFFTA